MKKHVISFMLCIASMYAFAQDRAVTGAVTAKEDGLPLPGVSVVVKGTTQGTVTGTDGRYSISVPAGSVLQFKFLGYATQEIPVGTTSTLNVVLVSDTRQLGEVVVTALGISRSRRSLGYAESTVRAEDINKSSPVSLFGGLQGKVAGVTISNVSGSPGGSTKVILRGYSNLSGSNQPLYVIDGVPLDNSRPGSDDNYDFGNNANDIDPNSIDNMSILKGSAATALYGSRGANGVVLITTKKGRMGKPNIDFSSGTTFTNLAIIYKPQETFGQGWDGTFILSENGNWGPKYTGQLRPWGAIVNNSQLLKPYSFIENNVKDAFNTGIELNNNLSISGGNEASSYFMSYGNIFSNGILPNDNDSYKRNTLNLKGATTIKSMTVEASVNYIAKNQRFVAVGQGNSGIGASFYEDLIQIPGDVPIKDIQDYKNLYFNVDNYFTPFAENPYYSLNENGSRLRSDRVFGNVNLNLKANSWMKVQFQQGVDVTNSVDKIWNNKNAPTPGSWNDGANVEGAQRQADVGNVIEESYKLFEYDSKLNALFNKELSPSFDLDGLVGINYNDRGSRGLSTSIENLAIPGFFQIANTSNKPTSAESESHRRLFGAYASATAGYKKYLYLTLTARNDWSSTLPKNGNSYFYPAANLAFILSDAIDLTRTPLSFVKLRASAGRTGQDASPYSIFNTLSSTSVGLGFGSINFPFNGVPGYSISNALRNATLKPSLSTEYELGAEVKFLDSRVGVDVAVYNKTTKDQILSVPISPSSGYTSLAVNFGEVRNKGIEVAFNANPVKTKDFNWNLTYTFFRDRNKVIELAEGLNQLTLNSAYDAQFVAVKDKPLGVFMAPGPQYDPQGHIIVNNQGYPVTSTSNMEYGSAQRDYQMGMVNNFGYKNFTLGFTFDLSHGGKFYSGTADLLNFVGADAKTTYNDRRPFIVPNSVQEVIGTGGAVTYVENTVPITESNIDDYYYHTNNKAFAYQNRILNASYFKLREATLSYTLPQSITKVIRANRAMITAYGRNLYVWLPKSNRSIDPEVSNFGTDLASQFGEFRTSPPVRSLGLSLKVTF